MNNDTASPLSDIISGHEAPLAARVMEIEGKAKFVLHKKAIRRCVQVDMSTIDLTSLSGRTGPIRLDHCESSEYIAVSCPWYLPGHDTVSGRYTFGADEPPPGVIMPPDAVLDRILRFKLANPDYLNTPFWVDKLCINQAESAEKEVAVHSMDLVYQYSGRRVTGADGTTRVIGCSLGLLFVEITTADQLRMLRGLLDSKFADFVDGKPTLLVPAEEAARVLDLVEMILGDNWWHRAWIFQEEFLASSSMVLLLPCAVDRSGLGLENEEGVDLFGQTPGEIEVRPLNFRSCVTELCLALCDAEEPPADEAVRRRCAEILKRARRYSFLHRRPETSAAVAGPHSVVRAMSPAIFEDIASRGITVPSDVLAIAANCCRYVTRLDAQVLNGMGGASLSVAVLAMFLMNGEIVRHDVRPDEMLGQSVMQCLGTAKLPIRSPVRVGELIFIKMCRLPAFAMTADGFRVRGVLSRLDKKIKVKVSIPDQEAYWKASRSESVTNRLNTAEERLLLVLAAHLRSIRTEGGDALHTVLTTFVEKKTYEPSPGRPPQYWSHKHAEVLMAKGVCRAMAEGRPLWLSRLHGVRPWAPWLGVFVIEDAALELAGPNVISFAFTASQSDHEFTDRGAKLSRKNTRITSLEVRYDPATGRIWPRRWLNGLCFYNSRNHPRELVIPWPAWMQ